MKTILLSLLLLPASGFAGGQTCDNYCVGVRGNGEAQPAHSAALARMVEDHGMPRAFAGGSSASITMFLAEQVRANPKAEGEADPEKKRKIQALMLKSMPEFQAMMTKDAKVADVLGMVRALQGGDPQMAQQAITAFQNAGGLSSEELQATLKKYGVLLNPELVKLVQKDPEKFGPEAAKSIQNLGKFNAVTDDTLLFRPGVIDFKGVAVVLGSMADFYAGNTDPETKAKLDGYLDDCADAAYHKEWGSVSEECRTRFQKIAGEYLKAGKFQHKALFERVGAHGESVPTTAVLHGDGLKKYNEMKTRYEAGTAENIADFSVNFKTDLSFGYWGKSQLLSQIDHGLEGLREQGDEKAKHFRALGRPNWFEVLCCSPAEPGIANAQKIPMNTTREQVLAELQKPVDKRWDGLHYRKDVLSVGGWSDLHPTAVLKNTPGCERTVYLTRHADYGDSKFGQQIFIRLTGTKNEIPFWDKIGTSGPGGWCDDKIRAAGGDPEKVRNTPWNQISNLCNPQSSFRRALDVADGTYCTDWDADANDVFQGHMRDLIKDAYNSPLLPTTAAGTACKLGDAPNNAGPATLPGCIPASQRNPGSRPTSEPNQGTGTGNSESAQ